MFSSVYFIQPFKIKHTKHAIQNVNGFFNIYLRLGKDAFFMINNLTLPNEIGYYLQKNNNYQNMFIYSQQGNISDTEL